MTDEKAMGATGKADGLAAQVLALSARAEGVLAADQRTRGLAANLPRADASPLRIALSGPYSAGKSMLIAALLRLPPEDVAWLTDAPPKTSKPTPYEWNDAILVDLPGTLSGDDDHAKVARAGVRAADALMIVTTSELPGEAETRAILDTLGPDGSAERSVVVVNKMHAENSDPEVIISEIRARLGPFADRVAIVPTDARDFVDGTNGADLTDAQRELLIAESGIQALEDELRRIVAPGAELVRARAQAFEVARVLVDAAHQWELEGEDRRDAESATDVAAAIAHARETVAKAIDEQSSVVASKIKKAGNALADGVSEKDGTVPTDLARWFDKKQATAVAGFETKLSSSMQAAFSVLVSKYGNDVAAPESRVYDPVPPPTTVTEPPAKPSRTERVAAVGKRLASPVSKEVSEAISKVAESDSSAAKVANRINKSRLGQKLLGGDKVGAGPAKWKPHGQGKATKKVAGAAGKLKWAAFLVGPALDLGGVANDALRRKKIDERREEVRRRSEERARQTRSDLSDFGTQWVDDWLDQVQRSLGNLTNRGTAIMAEREAALHQIKALIGESEDLLGIARRPSSQSA